MVGEFNDTARKYDLHKTGPKGARLHHQDVLGTGPQAGAVLRGQPRRPAPAQRRVGVRPAVAHLGHALRPGPAPRVHRPGQGHLRRRVQGRHPGHQARRAGGHRPYLVGADLRPAEEGPAVHEHLGRPTGRRRSRTSAATRPTCTTARRCGRSSRPRRSGRRSRPPKPYPVGDLRRDAGVRPRAGRERLAREQLADARHLAARLREGRLEGPEGQRRRQGVREGGARSPSRSGTTTRSGRSSSPSGTTTRPTSTPRRTSGRRC